MQHQGRSLHSEFWTWIKRGEEGGGGGIVATASLKIEGSFTRRRLRLRPTGGDTYQHHDVFNISIEICSFKLIWESLRAWFTFPPPFFHAMFIVSFYKGHSMWCKVMQFSKIHFNDFKTSLRLGYATQSQSSRCFRNYQNSISFS